MSKCQSLSTFSSENLSVSDGEEGNTTDHSHSGTPDVVSTNTDERLDDKSDDLLSQGSEIPADPSDPTQQGSDGLSEKEAVLRQVKTQLASNDHNYEVDRLILWRPEGNRVGRNGFCSLDKKPVCCSNSNDSCFSLKPGPVR